MVQTERWIGPLKVWGEIRLEVSINCVTESFLSA